MGKEFLGMDDAVPSEIRAAAAEWLKGAVGTPAAFSLDLCNPCNLCQK